MRFIFVLIISNGCSIYTANAFDSVTGNQSRNGWDIHSQISHPVLDKLGFSYVSFRLILTGGVSHDYNKKLVNTASMHCDRNVGVSHADAFASCREQFQSLFNASIKR